MVTVVIVVGVAEGVMVVVVDELSPPELLSPFKIFVSTATVAVGVSVRVIPGAGAAEPYFAACLAALRSARLSMYERAISGINPSPAPTQDGHG